MSRQRGSTVLFAPGTSVANGDKSGWAYTPGDGVTIYIDNEGANAHTFRVQVTTMGKNQAGLNEIDGDDPDGGMVWYDYLEKDNSAPVDLVVAGNANVAFDLTPFGPQLMRLNCTAAAGTNAVTAYVSSAGDA